MLRSAEAFEPSTKSDASSAQVLASLPSTEWRVFHDVRWPTRRYANIDHVVVGPNGVFVIETKEWSGSIDVKSGALRQDGKRRSRTVIAAAAAGMAVSELLPSLDIKAVKPVLCFVRGEPVFGWSGDVMICSTENVLMFLTSGPRVLDEAKVTDVAVALSISLDAAPARVESRAPASIAPPPPTRKKVARTRRQRMPRPPMPRPARIVLRLGLLTAVIALAFQFDLPSRLGDFTSQATQRVIAPTQSIGTAVPVPAMGSRPSLEVTAGVPVITTSTTPGVRPQSGHQLVAVRLRIVNTGHSVWTSNSDLGAEVTDQTDVSYSSDPAFTNVAAGTALPASMKLRAGKSTNGLVVFEVPAGTQVEKVRVSVGPALPKTLRWSVD
jgi:hypothetical protein